jgi:dTDP-glucose 4,6-dehydratase
LLLSDHAQPVNVGNPDEITILDFAKEIIQLTGTDQKIIFKELPTDDPKQRQPDITLAREILKWEPQVHRSEGLRITYDYFKSLTQDELNKVEHKNFDKYARH